MSPRLNVLAVCVLLAALEANVEAQVIGGSDQAELARALHEGNRFDRGVALGKVRLIDPQGVTPELQWALITALEEEGSLLAQARRGEITDLNNAELVSGLAHVVAAFRDPRSIDPLASALGTSPPATAALAEFGQRAVPAVLQVLGNATSTSVVNDALLCLRFMAEGASQPLMSGTREAVRRVAEERLTTSQESVTTAWRAIDLAIALDDPDLRSIVQSIASERDALAVRGVVSPELIDRTQRLAAERLAGVPPLPRHSSVEDFARRWK